MKRGRESEPPIEEVAQVTQRLAVLLSAGVSPVSAWICSITGSAAWRSSKRETIVRPSRKSLSPST